MENALTVTWIDHGHDHKAELDPMFPNGMNIDASFSSPHACAVDLPYPAQRCGLYVVNCTICGIRVGCTTAGRPDDPKSIKIACLPMASA